MSSAKQAPRIIPLTLLVASWLFLFLVPPPDFPLYDGIVFYEEARHLAQGKFWLFPTSEVSGLLQAGCGALVGLAFGLTHANLNATAAVIAGLAAVATYFWLLQWCRRDEAVLGAALLLSYPAFYFLSHTFMTDIPGVALATTAALLLFIGIRDRKIRYVAAGSASALAGFLVRQVAALPLLGAFLYCLLFERELLSKRRKGLAHWLLLLILPACVGAFWFFNFRPPRALPLFPWVIVPPWSHVRNLLQALVFIGAFFFPLGLLYAMNWRALADDFRKLGRISRLLVMTAAIGIVLLAALYHGVYLKWRYGVDRNPLTWSHISPQGVGPILIAGEPPLLYPDALWIPIFILSAITVTALLIHGLWLLQEGRREHLLLLSFIAFTVIPLAALRWNDHRHYLLAFPLLIPLLIMSMRRFRGYRAALMLTIALFSFWSVYGTHLYISWNAARWDGIDLLLQQGVPEHRIDGGMEYNARFLIEPYNALPEQGVNVHGWAYSLSDEYVVSLSPLPSYSILKELPYSDLFGREAGSVYVLEKA